MCRSVYLVIGLVFFVDNQGRAAKHVHDKDESVTRDEAIDEARFKAAKDSGNLPEPGFMEHIRALIVGVAVVPAVALIGLWLWHKGGGLQ